MFKHHSPAAERNKQPILEVLQRVLPPSGDALEIASGTGQHVAHFAAGLPDWNWQPSDLADGALTSIAAWSAGLSNVRPQVQLDVMSADWPISEADAIYCANMLHIAPWAVCPALMRGAARYLSPQGLLITYGPYWVEDLATAPSNLAFDTDLRTRDQTWGLRCLKDVVAEANNAGLQLNERVSMPANNFLLVFTRSGHTKSLAKTSPENEQRGAQIRNIYLSPAM